ncbi:hypothetical protein P5V15_001308 [Pogonomyrmex californicus]
MVGNLTPHCGHSLYLLELQQKTALFDSFTRHMNYAASEKSIFYIMNIIVDIQGFRDIEGKFIPKEVALIRVNEAFVDLWIVLPPYPFIELPEKSRKENN